MKKNIIVIIALLLGAARAAAERRIVDLSQVTAADVANGIVLQDGDILTGTLDVEHYPLKVSTARTHPTADLHVTLRNVTIDGINSPSYDWAGITCEGNATITLEGENIVRGFDDSFPGIDISYGYTLTIGGTGKLIVSPSNGSVLGYAAGIGCGSVNYHTGKIVITGGIITATGNYGGAGIGSGIGTKCESITITGGTITATGGYGAAGIGSGMEGTYSAGITISGGTINATGGDNAAGIGSGWYGSYGGITITGGTITAYGGKSAAAIGSGCQSFNSNSSSGYLYIYDTVNMITATKHSNWRNILGAGDHAASILVYSDANCTILYPDGNTEIIYGAGVYPLTPDATRKIWTLDAMPGGNIELTAEYYPYARVVAPMAADDPVFGTDAPIVTGASVAGGTLMYAVTPATTTEAPATGWSTDAHLANKLEHAGKLKVWYYAEGDATHSDTEPTVPVDVLVTRNIPGGADYIVATMSEGLTIPNTVQAYLPGKYESGASEITLTPLAGAPQGKVVILGSTSEGSPLDDQLTLVGALDDESDLIADYNAAYAAMDKKHFAITNGTLALGEVIAATGHTPSDAVVMVLSGGKFRAVDISDGDLDLNAKPGLLLFILSKWEYMQVGTKTSDAATRGIGIGDGGATGLTPIPSPTGEGSGASWYDMQGRRIDKPARKGVYIRNGKKIVVK